MHFCGASIRRLKEEKVSQAEQTDSLGDMEESVTFSDDRQCHAILQKLNEFRQNKEFCDLTLEVEDGRFMCHKSVLIGASDYFQGMFSSKMKESTSVEISLPFLKADVMELILQFMYIGCATLVSPDNHKFKSAALKERRNAMLLDKVQRLLGAADMFQLDTLKYKCELYIVPKAEPNNCLQWYSFADMYSLNILKGKCREVKMEKFEGVVDSDDFLQLDAESLVEYIRDSCVEVQYEDAIYTAVRKWYDHSPQTRAPHMQQVLGHVRFPFCTPAFFLDVIEEDALMRNPSLQPFVREYKEYHLNKMHFCGASIRRLKEEKVSQAEQTDSLGDMEESVTFSDDRQCHAILQKLNEFRQNKEFCDLTLEVEDGRFMCHKSVLIGASDYFQGMFSSKMKESTSVEISLPFLKADVMELILQFMYIGCATLVSPDNHKFKSAALKERRNAMLLDKVQRLLGAADMFQLDTLKYKCELYIVPKAEPNNCLQLYSFADMYSLNILKGKCREVKMEKFEGVVDSDDFLQLDAESLVEYIRDSCVEVQYEDAIYTAVRKWYDHSPQTRAPHMQQVLGHVRFPFCTPAFFLDVIEEDALMRNPSLQPFVREYKEYHLVAERRAEMTQAASERVQPRLAQMPQSLVIVGGRESLLTGNLQGWYLDEKTKSWRSLCQLPFKGSMYGVCTLWNKLYVTGGNDAHNQTLTAVWEFSGTSLTWTQKAEMSLAREQHGATSCAGKVVILGGIGRSKRILKSVESFDPLLNRWSTAPDLLDAVFGPAVASSSDRIYVIGGATFKLSELRYASNFSVQMYDTLSNQWSRLSNSIFRVTTGCATVLEGKVFVHCGYEKLSAVYKTDSDSWLYCGASPSGHARGRALTTKDGKILLLGGKYRNDAGEFHVSNRVDLYDSEKNQWTVQEYTLPKALMDFGVAWLRINPNNDDQKCSAAKKRRLSVVKTEETGVALDGPSSSASLPSTSSATVSAPTESPNAANALASPQQDPLNASLPIEQEHSMPQDKGSS